VKSCGKIYYHFVLPFRNAEIGSKDRKDSKVTSATIKRILITLFGIVVIAVTTLFGLKQWIGKSVESNIEKAQTRYPADAEEAHYLS
jgi:hypothetical protein